MRELYAQGDLLIERVADRPICDDPVPADADRAVVLAEGEFTGHHHVVRGRVLLERQEIFARDIPEELYVGHLSVEGPSAELVHEEHAPITLPRGTYRVRVQRELDPREARIVAD